jgi:nucleoside diphosphate kinase
MSDFSYVPRNAELFDKLLSLYHDYLTVLPLSEVPLLLYGSVSYAYFTGDDSIDVNDLDFVVDEAFYPRIVEACSRIPGASHELTAYRSVRIWRDGAKLSIHAEEMAREVADVRTDTVRFEIGGIPFESVNFENLRRFYAKTIAAHPDQLGYAEKYRNLLREKYCDQAFFLLKPSVVSDPAKLASIETYIAERGFEIVDRRDAVLSEEDVAFLYDDSYDKLLPILGPDAVAKAKSVGKRLYASKPCRILAVRGADAVARANVLKGETYWPAKCLPGTLRCEFRDPAYDSFEFPKGTIAEVPCDNVVHTAEDADEVVRVMERWFA